MQNQATVEPPQRAQSKFSLDVRTARSISLQQNRCCVYMIKSKSCRSSTSEDPFFSFWRGARPTGMAKYSISFLRCTYFCHTLATVKLYLCQSIWQNYSINFGIPCGKFLYSSYQIAMLIKPELIWTASQVIHWDDTHDIWTNLNVIFGGSHKLALPIKV